MSDLQLSVEISMYPLRENYLPAIDSFLEKLHQTKGLKVETSVMSTQVFGPSSLVFPTVQHAIEESYADGKQISFVLKILNGDVSEMELKGWK